MYQKKILASIFIDDQEIPYDELEVHQRYDWHHYYRILTDIPPSKGLLLQKAKDWIGKTIKIELEEHDFDRQLGISKKTNVFLGIVSGISHGRNGIGSDVLIIAAEGMSKLMDEGDHTRSFTDHSLKQIVTKIFDEYGAAAIRSCDAPKVKPKFQGIIPYIVQYKESNYEFLNRLAKQYGEWFYFTGQQFIFGKPADVDEIPLQINTNLDHFNLSVKLQPLTFKLSGYDYLKHEFPEAPAEYNGDLSKYAQLVFDRATGEAYEGTQTTLFPVNQSMAESQLKELAHRRAAMTVSEMVHIEGESYESVLSTGSQVGLQEDPEQSDEHYGQFLITQITHYVSETGHNYRNEFEGVPWEVPSLFYRTQVELPYAEGQYAEVTDINDNKESLGRVRVQFNWQKGTEEKSPWIRVITPQAGGDKGNYVGPELGDFVLVQFEQHNPDFPYVQGSFYHAKSKPEFFHPENNQKTIKTRSGNLILFDDEGGKESIKISNPDGKNVIVLALGDKPSITINTESDLNISAGSSINMSAPEITIHASESMALVGKEISSSAEKTFNVSGAELNLASDKSTKIKSSGPLEVKSDAITSINGQTIKLNS